MTACTADLLQHACCNDCHEFCSPLAHVTSNIVHHELRLQKPSSYIPLPELLHPRRLCLFIASRVRTPHNPSFIKPCRKEPHISRQTNQAPISHDCNSPRIFKIPLGFSRGQRIRNRSMQQRLEDPALEWPFIQVHRATDKFVEQHRDGDLGVYIAERHERRRQ
jgi:hypothetical protein